MLFCVKVQILGGQYSAIRDELSHKESGADTLTFLYTLSQLNHASGAAFSISPEHGLNLF